MTFGQTFVAMREARCWTQQDFADRIGKTRAAVSQWELDVRKPSYKTLKRIAEIFEVSFDDLIDEKHKTLETDWAQVVHAMREAPRSPTREEQTILVLLIRKFMKEV